MVSALDAPDHHQASNICMARKTVVQAHDTVLLSIGTITPDNQSAGIALATLRKHLAERQGDPFSHRVARKHWWWSRLRLTRFWEHTYYYKFFIGRGSWSFEVGCGRTDCYTIFVLLAATRLYPYVVDRQRFLACFHDGHRCYFSLVAQAILCELCSFSFQYAHISRCSFLCLQTFVNFPNRQQLGLTKSSSSPS